MNDIKLIILDVDGTLTDGTVYYGDGNVEIKAFSTNDGAVLKPLKNFGIDVIFLTGRKSEAVSRRATDLNAIAIQGVDDKLSYLKKLLSEHDVSAEQIAYIGDDLNDYAAMKLCGFKACPNDAAAEIKAVCDYVSPKNGGHGAVRDICEVILHKCGLFRRFIAYYNVDPGKNTLL